MHVHTTSLPPFVIATGVIALDEAIHILEQDLYNTGIREKQGGIPMPGTVIRVGVLLNRDIWSLGEVNSAQDLLSEDGLGGGSGDASPSDSCSRR